MHTDRHHAALGLARLLQLASPTLPVGAYSYSQGLESACDDGSIHDARSAQAWISAALHFGVARMEAPIWVRLHAAWSAQDALQLAHWNAWFLATRETAELRAETTQMGWSLTNLLAALDVPHTMSIASLQQLDTPSFPAAYTFAVVQWAIPAEDALLAYLWAWLENQVMAALKAVPLGQTDGQKILLTLGAALPQVVTQAFAMPDDGLANFLPGFAIRCSQHETQYSRLFRS